MSDLTQRVERGVLWITLDRPHRLNALTAPMADELTAVVRAAGGDPAVRAIAITGEGRGFCSGADLDPAGDGSAEVDTGTLDAVGRLTRVLREVPLVVVAAVNGPAAGVGASLALACDVVVIGESGYLVQSFASIGLMPDGGATALVPSVVGRLRAARMALLGERITASLAYEWGLASFVVPDEQVVPEAARLAERLAQGPTRAYAATKRALDRSTLGDLDAAIATEETGQRMLLASDDFAEGRAAFLERRSPRFTGG